MNLLDYISRTHPVYLLTQTIQLASERINEKKLKIQYLYIVVLKLQIQSSDNFVDTALGSCGLNKSWFRVVQIPREELIQIR